MPDPVYLFCALMFSIVGIAYWRHGRKGHSLFLITGIILTFYTYFVTDVKFILASGIALMIIPFVFSKYVD